MKGSSLVDKRYAKALYQVADGQLDRAKTYKKILKEIGELFENPEFKKILNSPVVPKNLKKEILCYVLDVENADKYFRAFVDKVVDVGRIQLFPGILKAFVTLLNEVEGVIEANLTSVFLMSKEELDALQTSLGRMTQKNVTMRQEVDPRILGGFIVRIGNNIVDLSLKSRLEAIVRNASW